MGLGMSNHQSFLFIGLPLFAWLLLNEIGLRRTGGQILTFFCVGALGLLPYGALPFFNPQASLISWGDLTTVNGFTHHILRSDYGTLHLAASFEPGNPWDSISAFFRDSFYELLWIGPLLAAFGIYSGILRRRTIGITLILALSFLAYVLIFHFLAGFPISDKIYAGTLKKFWLMPNLILVIFAGMGAAAFVRKFDGSPKIYRAVASLFLILALTQPVLHLRSSDQSQNWLYHEFGERLLAPLEPNALLIAYGDLDFFVAAYMKECEGVRKDVSLISQERLQLPWYQNLIKIKYPQIQLLTGLSLNNSQSLNTFLILNSKEYPLYLASRDPADTGEWQTSFNAWPIGFADRLLPKGETPNISDYISTSSKAWGDMEWMKMAFQFQLDWEGHIIHRFWWSEYNRAIVLIQHDSSADHLALNTASGLLTKLNTAFPTHSEIQNLLNSARQKLGQIAN